MAYAARVTASTIRLRPPKAPPTLFKRPRITDRILSLAPSEVAVISAAAGYGATTALLQATRISGDHLYWMSVDASMTDESCRELLATSVDAPDRSGIDGVLQRLESSPPCWLIVDGVSSTWHPGFARDLLALAEHLPDVCRMAIASPHWFGPLPRALRLSEEDLAFTDDEAMELLQRRQAEIDIDAADDVLDLCQGWGAALVSAATQAPSDAVARWLTTAGAVTLFGSWFASLPSAQQDFLRSTRVLRGLCGANTTALAATAQAGEMLLTLDASHAYLTETTPMIEGTGRWWLRHPLLTAYLDQMPGGDELADQSRAADWYLGTEDVESVMHHLLAAGRMKEAGAYLTDHESVLLSVGGNADKVLTWYDQMGDAIDDRYTHLLRIGWGQALSHDIVGADATVNRINSELNAQHDPSQPGSRRSGWVAEVALLRSYLGTFHADPATVISGARRVLAEPPEHVNSDSMQLAPILAARGLIWSGQAEAAAEILAPKAGRPLPNDVMRETHLGIAQALCDVSNGYVRRGKTRIEAAVRWMNRNNLAHDTLQFGPAVAVLAEVNLELGDVESARILAHQALEDAHRGDVLAEIAWAHLVIARCHLNAGDYGAAIRSLAESRVFATRDVADSAMAVVIDRSRAEAHLAAGDVVRAVRIIRGLPSGDARALLWARAGVSRQPAVARRTLESVHSTMPRTVAERHRLLAAIYMRVSRRMAQGHLRKAAAIAHTNGLGQLFHCSETGLLTLAESTALEYQDDNLMWLLQVKSAPLVAASGPETPLSRGEMQLLSVLPSRAKNGEIAADMGVSINTVKTRLRRLYAKLDVNTRDEAIEVARRRGLLT